MFCNYLALSYFNLVMSYSSFSRTSREIALFSITYIASYLLNMRYRLIDYQSVYCGYDNSSVLLSDNLCTLSIIEFCLFSTYITIHRKQPYKRIRMSDYLLDNSMPHDIVVMHMVNILQHSGYNLLFASMLLFHNTILTHFFTKFPSIFRQFFYFFMYCIY